VNCGHEKEHVAAGSCSGNGQRLSSGLRWKPYHGPTLLIVLPITFFLLKTVAPALRLLLDLVFNAPLLKSLLREA
jgi:hypothetical protein